MLHRFAIAIMLLVPAASSAQDAAQPGAALFDGETLKGWEGSAKWFRIEDKAIVAGSLKEAIPRNEFLCTQQSYGDFELSFEAKVIGENQNGGVQLRSRRIPDDHEVIGYQCDIGVAGRPVWGALYDESRRRKFLVEPNAEQLQRVVKPDDWNHLRVRCEGPRIQIWVNGEQTTDFREEDPQVARRGVIAVQIHGGPPAEIWYRNLRIKELGR